MSEKYPPLTKEKRAAYLRILHEPHAPMPSRYTVFAFEATVCDLEIQLAKATEERDELRRHLKALRTVSDAVAAMP